MGASIDVGDQIEGRFTIRAELAVRDSRSIFFGSDAQTGGRCEVHVLAATASILERTEFTREAELLGRIDHPGCLSTAGVGGLPDGTLYYIVAERAGTRITDRIGMELPAYHVADAAAQLLSALAHVHSLDWRIGWITPDQVDERVAEGRLIVRLVRMPAARPAGEAGPIPDTSIEDYAHPSLSNTESATVATDLYSVGKLVLQLATGSLSLPLPQTTARQRELSVLIDGLLGKRGAPALASAAAATAAFEEFCQNAEAQPPVPPPPRSHRKSRFRTSDITVISASPRAAAGGAAQSASGMTAAAASPATVVAPVDPRAPAPSPPSRSSTELFAPEPTVSGAADITPPGVFVEPVPANNSKWWALAGLAAAVIVGVVVVGMRDEAPASAPSTDPAAVAAPPAEAKAEAELEAAEGNPMRAIALLNRTDLQSVLGYTARHELIDEVAQRPDLRSRVNVRWNRLLDLLQAADSPTPCTTFRDALPALATEGGRGPAEQELVSRIVVPTPQTMLGAGVAPDGSCDGLESAFADATKVEAPPPAPPAAADVSEPPSRTRKRKAAKRKSTKRTPVPDPTPAAEPKPAKPSKPAPSRPPSVSTKLDDDLKGVSG